MWLQNILTDNHRLLITRLVLVSCNILVSLLICFRSVRFMIMPEMLLTKKAFNQQSRVTIKGLGQLSFNLLCRMMYVLIHRLIHSVTAIHNSICYANINIFMHSVSGGLHGILVLSKIKYPIILRGCAPQTPCFRDSILRVFLLLVNPRSAPACYNNLLTPVLQYEIGITKKLLLPSG